MIYFTLAANVGSVFLASGASVKCILHYCVNVLGAVFEIRPTAGEAQGSKCTHGCVHTQYVHMHAHT